MKEAKGTKDTEKAVSEEKKKDVRMRKDSESLTGVGALKESLPDASVFAFIFASVKRMVDKVWDFRRIVKTWSDHRE